MKHLKPLLPLVLLLGLALPLPADPPPKAVPPEEAEQQIVFQALIVRIPLSDDLIKDNPTGLDVNTIKGTHPFEQIQPLKPEILSRPQLRTLDGQSATISGDAKTLDPASNG